MFENGQVLDGVDESCIFLDFPDRKILRSLILSKYIIVSGFPGVVIFSCGNASATLEKYLPKSTGFVFLNISPNGHIAPTGKWWTPEEIRQVWPTFFDATSGHLPIPLMARMAQEVKENAREWLSMVPEAGKVYGVPTGSGETILILRWAFPNSRFIPIYNISPGTKHEPNAPLNFLVNP